MAVECWNWLLGSIQCQVSDHVIKQQVRISLGRSFPMPRPSNKNLMPIQT